MNTTDKAKKYAEEYAKNVVEGRSFVVSAYLAGHAAALSSGGSNCIKWVLIENVNSLPLETPIIIKHEYGIEAIHFWNAGWRYWYSGVLIKEHVLKTATHYINTNTAFRILNQSVSVVEEETDIEEFKSIEQIRGERNRATDVIYIQEDEIKELKEHLRQVNAGMLHFSTLDKMPTLGLLDRQGVIDHVVNIGKKRMIDTSIYNPVSPSPKPTESDAMKALIELVELKDKYIVFLTHHYRDLYTIAHVHGYRPDEKEVKKGIGLRNDIEEARKLIESNNESVSKESEK